MVKNSDFEILDKKNGEIKRLKLINAGLIMVTLLLLSIILFVFILSRVQPPNLNANVDVLTDVTPLVVPSEIVAGEAFVYRTSGFKHTFEGFNGATEAPTALVKLQYTCNLGDGKTTTFPFLEFYSTSKGGKYSVARETALPISARVKPANDCKLQSYSVYTLYITGKDGRTEEINFIERNESNPFKLVVNDDVVINSIPQNVSQAPTNSRIPTTEPNIPVKTRDSDPIGANDDDIDLDVIPEPEQRSWVDDILNILTGGQNKNVKI